MLTDDDLHYLRSILGNLREIRSAINDGRVRVRSNLGGEVLADNIDWLDCFIDRKQKDRP